MHPLLRASARRLHRPTTPLLPPCPRTFSTTPRVLAYRLTLTQQKVKAAKRAEYAAANEDAKASEQEQRAERRHRERDAQGDVRMRFTGEASGKKFVVSKDPLKIAETVRAELAEGRVTEALDIARQTNRHAPNVVSWNYIIDDQMKRGRWKEGWQIFNEMKKRAITPDGYTYSHLLQHLASKARGGGELSASWFNRAYSLYTSLTNPTTSGAPRQRPEIIITNLMLRICADARRPAEALAIFQSLPPTGPAAATKQTYTALFHALMKPSPEGETTESREDAAEAARRIWARAEERWRAGSLQLDDETVGTFWRVLLAATKPSGSPEIPAEIFACAERIYGLPQPGAAAGKRTNQYGNRFEPGSRTLSLLQAAALQARSADAARHYWDALTQPYVDGGRNVVADFDNHHAFLRVLAAVRAAPAAVKHINAMAVAERTARWAHERGEAAEQDGEKQPFTPLTPKALLLAFAACKMSGTSQGSFEAERLLNLVKTYAPKLLDARLGAAYLGTFNAEKDPTLARNALLRIERMLDIETLAKYPGKDDEGRAHVRELFEAMRRMWRVIEKKRLEEARANAEVTTAEGEPQEPRQKRVNAAPHLHPKVREAAEQNNLMGTLLRTVDGRPSLRIEKKLRPAEEGAAKPAPRGKTEYVERRTERAEQAAAEDDGWEDVPLTARNKARAQPKPESRARRREHVDEGAEREAAGPSAEAERIVRLEAELAAVKEQLASSRPREPERQPRADADSERPLRARRSEPGAEQPRDGRDRRRPFAARPERSRPERAPRPGPRFSAPPRREREPEFEAHRRKLLETEEKEGGPRYMRRGGGRDAPRGKEWGPRERDAPRTVAGQREF